MEWMNNDFNVSLARSFEFYNNMWLQTKYYTDIR